MQEVALVLAAIDRTQQPECAHPLIDAGVMAGGNGIGTQLVRGIEKMLELDLAVAQHVRVGGAASGVFGQKILEHAFPIFLRKITKPDRNTQRATHGYGVAAVVFGTALATAIVGPVLHEQANDFATRIAQQQRGHRGIHAARHAHHDLVAGHGSCCTNVSGCRLPPR